MKHEDRLQLEALFGKLCNGVLNDEEAIQLNQLLLASPAARQYYSDYLEVHLLLVDSARKGVFGKSDSESTTPDNFEYEMKIIDQPSGSADAKRLKIQPAIFWALSALAASVLILIAGYTYLIPTTKTDLVRNVPPASESLAAEHLAPEQQLEPLYLAQVVGMSDDVIWTKHLESSEFLLRMRRGDRIGIEAGLVQVEYYSGAVLILSGPCSYVVTGNASGRLEKGQLTGKVAEGDFLLSTPTARVIDLGTEFGVSVDSESDTSVCVFDGKVEVVSEISGANSNVSVLTEGMSAKVDRGGTIDRQHNVDATQFTRSLPVELVQKENEVSLVDLFSAKSKSQYRLAGVITPDTGKSDRNPWLRDNGPGHRIYNGYQRTSWHPFVDGVFIPAPTGEYSWLDSAGHTIDLPQTTGRTWGPIWSRRKFNPAETGAKHEDYWGTETLNGVIDRLQRCETGMIGIHANVGVTFDLDSVRGLDLRPVKFRTIVENLDNSLERDYSQGKDPDWAKTQRFNADFRVFVDGVLRDSRIDFTRADGELAMEVDLHDGDRFLTLVSTDGGGRLFVDGFDHVVLIDPVLDVEKLPELISSEAGDADNR